MRIWWGELYGKVYFAYRCQWVCPPADCVSLSTNVIRRQQYSQVSRWSSYDHHDPAASEMEKLDLELETG